MLTQVDNLMLLYFQNVPFYIEAKYIEYRESAEETLIFGILICWKWLGTNNISILISMQLHV